MARRCGCEHGCEHGRVRGRAAAAGGVRAGAGDVLQVRASMRFMRFDAPTECP